MSIIFDKGAERALEEIKVPSVPDLSPSKEDYPQTFAVPEQSDEQVQANQPPAELDERSQFAMYGSMTDQPLVFNDIPAVVLPPSIPLPVAVPAPVLPVLQPILLPKTKKTMNASDVPAALTLPENIPTPPIRILDANGRLMRIPTSVVDLPVSDGEDDTSASDKLKASSRMMDLDDLAMLGIDADDMAAQCI